MAGKVVYSGVLASLAGGNQTHTFRRTLTVSTTLDGVVRATATDTFDLVPGQVNSALNTLQTGDLGVMAGTEVSYFVRYDRVTPLALNNIIIPPPSGSGIIPIVSGSLTLSGGSLVLSAMSARALRRALERRSMRAGARAGARLLGGPGLYGPLYGMLALSPGILALEHVGARARVRYYAPSFYSGSQGMVGARSGVRTSVVR